MIELENPPGTMAEVRAGIDALDRQIVRLLSARQRYIEAAGRIKPARDQVRDEARIADVIDKVLTESRLQGLDPEVAERVWRAMMEGFIALEYRVFDQKLFKT